MPHQPTKSPTLPVCRLTITQMQERPNEEQSDSTLDLIHFQLFEQALEGQPSPKTIQFTGSKVGQSVSVLVDTWSLHNMF
ncbi:hypothetical protein Lal_00022053 [Lupinus albus]|nr:hypothetical protein Lal_00022053 [Lupinus albus]